VIVGNWLVRNGRRRSLLVAGAFFAIPILYSLLLRFPQLFYSHMAKSGNLQVYYRAHEKDDIEELAIQVHKNIQASRLYSEDDAYRIFLTSSKFEYAIYTSIFCKSAGFYNAIGNVFIRPANMKTNQLIKFDGTPTSPKYTIEYFLTHETIHAMTAARIGVVRYLSLPAWIREGVAEAKSRGYSFEELVQYKKANNQELYVRQNYLLHALRVLYLQEIEHYSEKDILDCTQSESAIDKKIDSLK